MTEQEGEPGLVTEPGLVALHGTDKEVQPPETAAQDMRSAKPSGSEQAARWILRPLFWLNAVTMAATVIIVLVEIYARYIADSSLGWSENILGVLFTWMVFLNIPGTIWRDDSPSLNLLSGINRDWVDARRKEICTGITFAYLIYILASYAASWNDQVVITLQPLGWRQVWETIPIPIGCALALILLCIRVMRDLAHWTSLVVSAVAAAVVIGILLSPVAGMIVGLVLLVVLIGLGVPIAVALGLGAAGMISVSWANLATGASQLIAEPTNVALLALPLFMLMGGIVANTELINGLSRLVARVFGWLPGGTGVADIAASAIFANMTGNAAADTATIGTLFIPQMTESGDFEIEQAAAVQAAGGVIGVVFPPATTMILFASVVALSVTSVFKATLIPALILVIVLAGVTVVGAKRRGRPMGSFSLTSAVRALPAAIPVLLIPVILDGGIFSGIFAPFESGAVAVAVVLIYLAARREISWHGISAGLETAFSSMTMAMFILVNVSIVNYAFTATGLSGNIGSLAAQSASSKLIALLIINIVFLLLHTVVDVVASIVVFVPLILPAANAAHISLLQLAAVIGINSTIGVILPPVGIGLYVASGIAGVSASRVMRYLWPYVISSLAVLVLVSAVPALSTWL